MIYKLKKDLGSLKKGTHLKFMGGVFVAEGAAFDPLDVVSDTDSFEEVAVDTAVSSQLAFQTI